MRDDEVPWVAWCAKDHLLSSSVRSLLTNSIQHSLYRWLLDYQAVHGAVPDHYGTVCRLYPWTFSDDEDGTGAGLPLAMEDFENVRALFDQRVVDGVPVLVNLRMEIERGRSKAYIEARRRGGEARARTSQRSPDGRLQENSSSADSSAGMILGESESKSKSKTERESHTEEDPPTPRKRGASRAPRAPVVQPPLPSVLDVPAFKAVWESYTGYRRERKIAPYTETGLKTLFTKLAKLGVAGAIAAIETTMAKNWQGVVFDGTGPLRFDSQPRPSNGTIGGRGDVMDAGQTRNWFEEQKALKAKVDAERRGGKTQSLSDLLPKNGVTP